MWETALANGQRSQWVGRFTRVRPSVPTRPGLLKQLSHTPASARCEGSLSTGSQTGLLAHVRVSQAGSMYSQATVSAVLVVLDD